MRATAAIPALALIASAGLLVAGPLSPPAGPIAPTYKTLSEVEPRIAVNDANTPGSAFCAYRISQPGSYYLTGNIAGIAGKDVIIISADHVTLDLNGFTVSGGNRGILVSTAGTLHHIAVVNGHVKGCAAAGVAFLGTEGGLIREVCVDAVAGTGIIAGARGTVRGCAVNACTPGIDAGLGTLCVDCTAQGCPSASFQCISDCVFDRCMANYGSGAGFSGLNRNVIRDCAVDSAAGAGITVENDCLIERCRVGQCSDNAIVVTDGSTVRDCEVSRNVADGISAGSRCSILSNSVHDNALSVPTGTGIRITGDGGVVRDNRVMNNGNWGIYASGAANLIAGNFSRGHLTSNFTAFAGNDSGQALVAPGVGFVSSNPWANITH